jgi:methyl-accepting chemotaxis protein
MSYAEEELLLAPQRQQAEHTMLGTLGFLFACGLAVAAVTDTWAVALIVGLPSCLVPLLLSRLAPGTLAPRLAIGCAFMIFSAQFIQQSRGLIEAHFLIFVLLAFLLYFRDWRTIICAAVLIAVHHVLFDYLQASNAGLYVFNYGSGFKIVALHAVFVVFEAGVLVYLAIRLRLEAVETQEVAKIARDVAAGQLQSAGDENTAGRPLLAAVVAMRQQLAATFAQIRQQSETVAHSVGELAIKSRAVAGNMEEQHSSARQVAERILALNAAVRRLADNAGQASQLARDSGTAAVEGAAVVKSTVDEISSIAATIQDSARNVEQLGSRSDRVVEIVRLIKDIAGQTNLLALNAAIEAARAGEQGRGFAVVADEVRKLAERTSQATEEIDGVMREILESKTATLTSIEAAVTRVEHGVGLASAAGQSIERITDSAGAVDAVIADISQTLREQSQVADAAAQQVADMASIAEACHVAVAGNIEHEDRLQNVARHLEQAVQRFSV